ncbi:MAG: hypothetical protein QOD05_2340, partial [Microbacteriaceae bacterium]|nr:hypothetical protein [Microbacteriaceae bacterium]
TPVRAERWGGADDSGRQNVPAGNVLAHEAANRAGLDASGDRRRENPDMG